MLGKPRVRQLFALLERAELVAKERDRAVYQFDLNLLFENSTEERASEAVGSRRRSGSSGDGRAE